VTNAEKATALFKANHRETELNEFGHRTIGTVLPFTRAEELPNGDVLVTYRVISSVEGTEERRTIYSAAQLA
jgi:hypothetical protein